MENPPCLVVQCTNDSYWRCLCLRVDIYMDPRHPTLSIVQSFSRVCCESLHVALCDDCTVFPLQVNVNWKGWHGLLLTPRRRAREAGHSSGDSFFRSPSDGTGSHAGTGGSGPRTSCLYTALSSSMTGRAWFTNKQKQSCSISICISKNESAVFGRKTNAKAAREFHL